MTSVAGESQRAVEGGEAAEGEVGGEVGAEVEGEELGDGRPSPSLSPSPSRLAFGQSMPQPIVARRCVGDSYMLKAVAHTGRPWRRECYC